MAEVVAKSGVSKEKGYLYYLGKDGNVWRSQMARAGKGGGNAEKVADAGVTRESGYLYYIDKNGDNLLSIDEIVAFVSKGMAISDNQRKAWQNKSPLHKKLLIFIDRVAGVI